MKKSVLFIPLFLLSFTALFSQLPEKAEKKKEKAIEKFESGKPDDARKILRGLTEDYPWAGSVWELMVKMEWSLYLQKKEEDKKFGGMNVVVTKDGKESKDDPLAKMLMEMLKPSRMQYGNFLSACREATAKCETAEYASLMLRATEIDEVTDTAVKPEAMKIFWEAEEQFQKKNFNEAVKLYKKASELDTTFYKARLYIGDSYYNNQEYEEAAKYFREAVKVKPTSCEARKYLTDAYINLGEWERAEDECINSLIIYPDIGMFLKLEVIRQGKGKKFSRLWIPRPVYPSQSSDQVFKGKDKEWKIYLGALKEIKPFCNDKGIIIKTNSLTASKYAEVYAWEKMLASAPPEKFQAAKKMKAAGFLESYVLFSLYHYDLHDQYKDFSGNNRVQLEKYIDMLLSM